MKKSHVGWQTLVVILLATVYVAAPGLSLAGTAKGVRLSPKVADPQTDFLAVQVGSDGTFNMGANPLVADCGTGPTFDTPCRYNLMFAWPAEPGSSFTTVRIDGSDFIYGSAFFGPGTLLPTVVPPTDTDPFTNLSAVEFFGTTGPVRVTQELKIVPGLTGNRDTARIRYVATNLDSVSHNVGLRIMLDTMLNDNDGAPFRVNGASVTTETDYVGAAVPSFFDVFFDLNVPGISARGTLRDGVVTPPDRFVIAAWPNISDTRFNFTVDPTHLVTNDSAIGIYWNPVSLGGVARVRDLLRRQRGGRGWGSARHCARRAWHCARSDGRCVHGGSGLVAEPVPGGRVLHPRAGHEREPDSGPLDGSESAHEPESHLGTLLECRRRNGPCPVAGEGERPWRGAL